MGANLPPLMVAASLWAWGAFPGPGGVPWPMGHPRGLYCMGLLVGGGHYTLAFLGGGPVSVWDRAVSFGENI